MVQKQGMRMDDYLPPTHPPLPRDFGEVQAIHQWPMYSQGDYWSVFDADGGWVADFKTEKAAAAYIAELKGTRQ